MGRWAMVGQEVPPIAGYPALDGVTDLGVEHG